MSPRRPGRERADAAPTADVAPVAPRRLVGRYRLDRELGRGAMGTVWAAYDEVLHRPVAVKEVRLSSVPAGERSLLRERTLREARASAMLSHPNVITLYDVVEVASEPYVVMELLPSHTLADRISEEGPLGATETAEVGSAVASALITAHRAGITHRDVKPGNVLLGAGGQIKLSDFGIARNAAEASMTRTGTVLGSPPYIAPEVAMGRGVGPAADQWGLGATLFACLEGRPPYDAGDAVSTVSAVVHGEVPQPHGHGPVVDVIQGLMVKDPTLRMPLPAARRRLRPLLGSSVGGPVSPAPGITSVTPRRGPAVSDSQRAGLLPVPAATDGEEADAGPATQHDLAATPDGAVVSDEQPVAGEAADDGAVTGAEDVPASDAPAAGAPATPGPAEADADAADFDEGAAPDRSDGDREPGDAAGSGSTGSPSPAPGPVGSAASVAAAAGIAGAATAADPAEVDEPADTPERESPGTEVPEVDHSEEDEEPAATASADEDARGSGAKPAPAEDGTPAAGAAEDEVAGDEAADEDEAPDDREVDREVDGDDDGEVAGDPEVAGEPEPADGPSTRVVPLPSAAETAMLTPRRPADRPPAGPGPGAAYPRTARPVGPPPPRRAPGGPRPAVPGPAGPVRPPPPRDPAAAGAARAPQPLAADPGPLPFTPRPGASTPPGDPARRWVAVIITALLVVLVLVGAVAGYVLIRAVAGHPPPPVRAAAVATVSTVAPGGPGIPGATTPPV